MGNLQFNQVQINKPKRNVFDLTHDVKMSAKFGNLFPCLCMDVLPGDKIKLGADMLLRFAPLLAPVMHQFTAYVHYFFVPNRILWDNWEKYITSEPSSTQYAPPYFNLLSDPPGNYTPLMDYMGIPNPSITEFTGNDKIPINALPFAAYQKIYNEFYRDENLCPAVSIGTVSGEINLDDGDNSVYFAELATMRKRAWEHDYFTSCLPFAQKGNAVQIPLEISDDVAVFFNKGTGSGDYVSSTGDNVSVPHNLSPSVLPINSLYADTAGLTGSALIEDLRRAVKLQSFLELSARGGTRYTESIRAHWGVKSPDSRLQRPEYITGCRAPIIVSEVLNTTGTQDAPQGNMAGHGVGVTQGNMGSYFAVEHGFIIGIMSVMPKTSYQQGLPKMFSKIGQPIDYAWPMLANIGEQAILNQEVYLDGDGNENLKTFGYLPRYSEYKSMSNRVAGDFKSSLKFWTDTRIFANRPYLNQEFIECPDNAGDHNIFAVQDDSDYLYIQLLNKIKAVRALPMFGVPSL